MYLIYFTIGFMLLAIPSRDRFEWGCLAILSLLLYINILIIGTNWDTRYLNRCSLILICGMVLLWRNTPLAFYQAVVLLLFLIANMCLMYDIAHGRHILILNHFKAVIYGLVVGQFLGAIPAVWRTLRSNYTGRSTPFQNNSMDY